MARLPGLAPGLPALTACCYCAMLGTGCLPLGAGRCCTAQYSKPCCSRSTDKRRRAAPQDRKKRARLSTTAVHQAASERCARHLAALFSRQISHRDACILSINIFPKPPEGLSPPLLLALNPPSAPKRRHLDRRSLGCRRRQLSIHPGEVGSQPALQHRHLCRSAGKGSCLEPDDDQL